MTVEVISFDADAVAAVVSVLSVPFIAALAVSVATLIVPTVRWARRLKRDAEIMASLPEGEEKSHWEARVTEQATQLREYLELVPAFDRIAGWGTVALMVVAAAGTLVFGVDGLMNLDPTGWSLSIAGLVIGVVVSFNTLRGRTYNGLRADEFKPYLARESARYARASARRKAQRRLRRLSRKAPESTDGTRPE
jgi:hypothetical protein